MPVGDPAGYGPHLSRSEALLSTCDVSGMSWDHAESPTDIARREYAIEGCQGRADAVIAWPCARVRRSGGAMTARLGERYHCRTLLALGHHLRLLVLIRGLGRGRGKFAQARAVRQPRELGSRSLGVELVRHGVHVDVGRDAL